MRQIPILTILLACLTTVTGALLLGTAATGGFSSEGPSLDQFLRTREADGGRTLVLDIASQTYEPAEDAQPVVHLVAAVHVGSASYYRDLQTLLDECDLVLFEGVAPYGAGAWQPGNDDQRRQLTRMRLRSLAAAVFGYWQQHGEAPASLEALADAGSADEAALLSVLRNDGWGRAIVYLPPSEADKGAIMSLGADGVEGGEGTDADIRFADLPPLSGAEKGSARGIQDKLARALGLQFQLNAIDYDRDHFLRADMSMDEVERALEARGVLADDLFGLLNGSSPLAKIADLLFGLLRLSNTMQETVRAIIIKVVSLSDELMAASAAEQGDLMKVLIDDRNERVMEIFKKTLAGRDVESIAIFYGAGHLPDLATRLERDFDYRPGARRWFTAFSADLSRTGMTAEQLDALVDQALEQMRAQSR
ncbi:MAG: type II secretion system protein GspG [Phycisphaerales bacterium JB038]